MEWVEVEAKTVDLAVAAALEELGLDSPEEVTVEVIREPKSGFLGLGGQDAIVRVTKKPARKRRRRRAKSGKNKRRNAEDGKATAARSDGQGTTNRRQDDRSTPAKKARPAKSTKEQPMSGAEKPKADIEEQARLAADFLRGLIAAFGLEGEVRTRVEDDILWIDVVGEQTEALVGPKGQVMQAVLELTRTVIQRKTFGAPRMRLDIAGYGERRREALKIYAGKLADRVLEQGVEIMLEPMNAADRKVVHDTVAGIEGVRSYSEGEEPERAVVIAPDEDATPATPDEDPAVPPAAPVEDVPPTDD